MADKQVGFKYNSAGQVTNVYRYNQLVGIPTDGDGSILNTLYMYDGADVWGMTSPIG